MSIIAVIIRTSDLQPRCIHTNGRAIGGSPVLVLNIASSYTDDSWQMSGGECRAVLRVVSCRDLHFHVEEKRILR